MTQPTTQPGRTNRQNTYGTTTSASPHRPSRQQHDSFLHSAEYRYPWISPPTTPTPEQSSSTIAKSTPPQGNLLLPPTTKSAMSAFTAKTALKTCTTMHSLGFADGGSVHVFWNGTATPCRIATSRNPSKTASAIIEGKILKTPHPPFPFRRRIWTPTTSALSASKESCKLCKEHRPSRLFYDSRHKYGKPEPAGMKNDLHQPRRPQHGVARDAPPSCENHGNTPATKQQSHQPNMADFRLDKARSHSLSVRTDDTNYHTHSSNSSASVYGSLLPAFSIRQPKCTLQCKDSPLTLEPVTTKSLHILLMQTV